MEHKYIQEQAVDVLLIGAGLTALATAYYLGRAGLRVALLEQASRVGGQIQTMSREGFVFETGPNTGIVSNLEVQSLLDDLGDDLVEYAKPTARRRLILRRGRFAPLPSGLYSALSTPLFSWKDKLRILLEPFRAKGDSPNETIASLVKRRLGGSYLTYAVDPFVGGIYAGDPNTLVTRHALPRLYALEQEYGSFIRGAIAKMRQRGHAPRPSKAVFSCRGGLNSLTSRLAQEIGAERIYLDAKIQEVAHEGANRWTVACRLGETLLRCRSRTIVSTVGGYAIGACFPFLKAADLAPIQAMRYAPVVQVAVGYREATEIDFDAFGGLVPSVEDADILGILNPTACFANRAPKDGLLLSVFLGGLRSPRVIERTDDEIVRLVTDRLRSMLGIERTPDLVHIARHQYAIPQYEASTDERICAIEHIERSYPGLYLAGGLRDGIGIADRVAQASRLAQHLVPFLASSAKRGIGTDGEEEANRF